MTFRHYKLLIIVSACLILFSIISCAENNKRVTRMSPSDDKSCRLVLIRVRTELQSVNDAVSRYEKRQEAARKSFNSGKSDLSAHYARLRDGAKEVQSKVDKFKQEFNALCPANSMSKQSQKEYNLLAADIKKAATIMGKIDCSLCRNLKFSQNDVAQDKDIAACSQQVNSPDKCKDSDISSCKTCCNNFKLAEEIDSSAGTKPAISREACLKGCSARIWDCNVNNCKSTDQCRNKVVAPECDIQVCKECCSANCPSGIDNCSADCTFAAAKCVLQQLADKATEAVAKLPQN
jgi:hypothetical protein